MTTKKIRLEKKDGGKTLFIEFQLNSRNSVMRVWNKFLKSGLASTLKDRENFQNPEDVSTYIKNQKGQLEKDGWVLAGSKTPEQKPAAATPSASDLE